jgi:hypothetical protein
MAKSLTEALVIQRRRSGGQLLVPLLEKLFEYPVRIDNAEDQAWMNRLIEKGWERVKKHGNEGTDDGVFSPSALASCVRKVYLKKNWRKLGIERVQLPRIDANGYFLKGDFIHLQWQFALYKLMQRCDGFDLVSDGDGHHMVEHPVVSKRGDHAGTVDAVCNILGEIIPVDVKGVHVRAFQQAIKGNVDHNYRIQTVDYGILANSDKEFQRLVNHQRILRSMLLFENKGGPDPTRPLALHEVIFNLKEHAPEVRLRLETVREYERREEIPPPECEKTTTFQFKGCPFSEFCLEEVEAIQRKNAAGSDSNGLRVARPRKRRTRRTGRP